MGEVSWLTIGEEEKEEAKREREREGGRGKREQEGGCATDRRSYWVPSGEGGGDEWERSMIGMHRRRRWRREHNKGHENWHHWRARGMEKCSVKERERKNNKVPPSSRREVRWRATRLMHDGHRLAHALEAEIRLPYVCMKMWIRLKGGRGAGGVCNGLSGLVEPNQSIWARQAPRPKCMPKWRSIKGTRLNPNWGIWASPDLTRGPSWVPERYHWMIISYQSIESCKTSQTYVNKR